MASDKSFISYIAESKPQYKYMLKFAVNEMTDRMIDCLESALMKYELVEASSFRKTPIQESPLDFPNVRNTSVFICDVTLDYPASLDFLRTYVCNCLGLSPQVVAVYSDNDPRQIETDLFLERSSPEYEKNYKPRLGSDYEQDFDAKKLYGEGYNTEFLKELEKVRKEREIKVVDTPLSQPTKVDHSTLTKDYHGYNDDKNLPKGNIGFFGRIKKPNFKKVGMP